MSNYRQILEEAIELIDSGEYLYCCNAVDRAAGYLYLIDFGCDITRWIDNALNTCTFSYYLERNHGISCKQKYRVEFLTWLMNNTHVIRNKDYRSWEQHMSFIKNKTQNHVE